MNKPQTSVTVAELIALDPPSAGTKAPDNPLAEADVIFACFSDGSQSIVYGKARLEGIVESGKARALLTVRVRARDGQQLSYNPPGSDLEALVAMVVVLHGAS